MQNRNGAIKLLGQQNAHHAVRQGQAGKAHHHVCLLFQTVGHTVCAADNKADVFAILLPAFQVLRQFDRSRRFAALVQYHQKRALRYGFQQAFFFSRHALSRIHTRAAFLWLDFFQRIIDIAPEAFGVLADGFIHPTRHFRADSQDGDIHGGILLLSNCWLGTMIKQALNLFKPWELPSQPTENKRPSESRMYPVRLFQTAFQ